MALVVLGLAIQRLAEAETLVRADASILVVIQMDVWIGESLVFLASDL